MDDLGKQQTIDELFSDASKEARETALRKFTLDFDLDNKEVSIQTKARDADGKPLFNWKIDQELKNADHIGQIPIVNPKVIIEKNK